MEQVDGKVRSDGCMSYIERDIWKKLPDDLPYKASVKRVLIEASAADVVEVKHGRWVNKEVDEIQCHVYGNCSVCHERKRIDNYCPNCGAKMDLKGE